MSGKQCEGHGDCDCPPKCFCKYDEQELVKLGYKKFIKKIPTPELINNAKTKKEKEFISVIAMLDLDDSIAEIMVREKMAAKTCDVISCRNDLKRRLYKLLESSH